MSYGHGSYDKQGFLYSPKNLMDDGTARIASLDRL